MGVIKWRVAVCTFTHGHRHTIITADLKNNCNYTHNIYRNKQQKYPTQKKCKQKIPMFKLDYLVAMTATGSLTRLDVMRLDATWLDVTWRRDATTWLDVTWLDVTWLDVTWLDETWLDVTWLTMRRASFSTPDQLYEMISMWWMTTSPWQHQTGNPLKHRCLRSSQVW